MTTFWNAPVVDMLDRANLIDDISMLHALDRVTRMREWTRDLVLESDVGETIGSDRRIVFGNATGAAAEIRIEGSRMHLWMFGPSRNPLGWVSNNTRLSFPSDDQKGAEDPTTPGLIVEAWIRTLGVGNVKLEHLLDDVPDGRAEDAMKRPLVDACALIAAYNGSRRPGSVVKLKAPSPGMPGCLTDGTGRSVLRREVERALLADVPTVLRFDINGTDSYHLNRLEFKASQKVVPNDAVGVMRTLAERDLAPAYDPLLAAGRRP
jgi:hypothetical protein